MTVPPQPERVATERVIARAFDQWNTAIGREFGGLSRPQRRVLRMLADRGQGDAVTRVGDLATLTGLTTAGATRMLDTLEGLGYARRYRDPDADQRQVYVALTEAGSAALAVADSEFVERVAATLAPLTPAERASLATLLRRLAVDGAAGQPAAEAARS